MSIDLPYGRHVIDDDDIAAVSKALSSGLLTTGPAVGAFEAALAKKTGAGEAIVCSSGTAALHLTALALDLQAGDQVVVPTVTFLATANAARYVGAEVVFADVDPDTGLMGPAELERALERADGNKVKAVYPVHLAGQGAESKAIADIAAAKGLSVVEDACHALGGSYRDSEAGENPVGNCRHADMAAFSFHPVKTIAMGEGGAITTNDPKLGARMRSLRNHGMVRAATEFQTKDMAFADDGEPEPWYYEMPEIGFNYRASDIHCALGLSQLGKLERFVDRRRALVEQYDARIAALAPLAKPLSRTPGWQAGWHLYIVLVDFAAASVSRGELIRRLGARGIGTQVHYIPVHLQPYYRQRYGDQQLPGSERFYARCLSLPLSVGMEDGDIERVVDALAAEIGAT